MHDFVGKHIDRYRITDRLGMGGMAVVYKAYDTRLEREVAVKLIRMGSVPADHHERLKNRFEREAKTQARLAHSNIVPVYADGEVDGEPYLVMAYLSGGTLKDKLGKPNDYRTAIKWTMPIADALSYAHEMGVIHRDVKPSNILFNHDHIPLLADFGIAKILEIDDMTLTATGLGVGTPEYMAPEQWLGETSFASDQYAVGVLLYELLTAQKPYSAETPFGVALMQLDEPLLPPTKIVPDIPGAVESLIVKAMSPDPHERYQDMRVFHNALEDALMGKVVLAHLAPNTDADRYQTSVDEREGGQLSSEVETVDMIDQRSIIEHLSSPEDDLTQDQLQKPRNVKNKNWRWAITAGGFFLLALSFVTSMRWGVPVNARHMNWVQTIEPKAFFSNSSITQFPNEPMVDITSNPEPTQNLQMESTAAFAPTEPILVTEKTPERFTASFNYIHNNIIKHYDGKSGEITEVMDIMPSANPKPLSWNQRWNETRWSANGRYLLYSPKSSEKDGSWDYYDNGLYIYDTISKTAFTVSEKLNRFKLLPWSPNHEYALFSSDIEGVPGLFIYDINYQLLTTVVYLTQNNTNISLAWSGDSQFFEFRVTGYPNVRKYDVQTGELSDSPNQRIGANAEQEMVIEFFDEFPWYREFYVLEEDDTHVYNFYFDSSCITINLKPDMSESNKLCFNEEVTFLGKSHNQLYHYFHGYDKLYFIDMKNFEVNYFNFEPGFSSPKECTDLT